MCPVYIGLGCLCRKAVLKVIIVVNGLELGITLFIVILLLCVSERFSRLGVATC